MTDRTAERFVAAAFAVTALSGLALLVLYVAGGQTQLEGLLLGICLGSLGLGIVVWAQRLMATPAHVEARHPLASSPEQRQALMAVMEEEGGFTRRRFLVRMLLVAVGGVVSAILVPVFSLGPLPGTSLFVTPWRKGSRLVGVDGKPVRADDLKVGGVVTVFPEDAVGAADAQTILIRVGPGLLRLPADRMAWAPDGYVAYSKLCTHAGCPVGLYRDTQHRLICPCHQSTFDVLDGAQPVFGPAPRPLPQLPIALQPDGTFIALGDFPEPVGPGFWDRTQG